MRLISILILVFLLAPQSRSQESDNLESLSLPKEEPITGATKKAETDLSLPIGKGSTSSEVKSRLGDTKKAKDNVGAILDFEGEVIEGERRRPDLFLQISIDNIKFDSLIYNRDDFNDYLEVDRKSRTRFLKMK